MDKIYLSEELALHFSREDKDGINDLELDLFQKYKTDNLN
jgi:hypothetical protein